jgi:hypothetical protein
MSPLITALRANGGDSAYVPTTSIYSSTDQVVQPQSGNGASAFILDNHAQGVANIEIQQACANQAAGGFVTHEGVMYNGLTVALAIDALKNPGVGNLNRINVNSVCSQWLSSSLTLQDLFLTEGKFLCLYYL